MSDPITITFEDDSQNRVGYLLEEQMRNIDDRAEKFDMVIEHLDNAGNVIQTVDIKGCFITEINRSGLDYSASKISTIDAVIIYDDVWYS